jgi:hypothetical protein
MRLTPRANVIKHFLSVIYEFPKKLMLFQLLHSRVGSWPYPKNIDNVGRASQVQTFQLIMNIRKLKSLLRLKPGAIFIKHFMAKFTNVLNKLECLPPASFSSLVFCLRVTVRPEPTQVEKLSGAPL